MKKRGHGRKRRSHGKPRMFWAPGWGAGKDSRLSIARKKSMGSKKLKKKIVNRRGGTRKK